MAHVSETLADAASKPDFPKHQLRRWLWIGAQYRIAAAQGSDLAHVAGAALAFLEGRLNRQLTQADTQDLNWVVESTVRRLLDVLGGQTAFSFLSADEMGQLEARLAEYESREYLESDVRTRVAEQLVSLAAASGSSEFSRIEDKVAALFVAASGNSAEGQAARGALLYLADHNDVVSDSEGLLGLLDDVSVIDLAYAVVEKQTRCLPLLRALLNRYPYVADIALGGRSTTSLDLYGQFVCCAMLEVMFASREPTLLVMRESGPFSVLSAFFGAIELARRAVKRQRENLRNWPIGHDVVLSDGVTKLKVVFLGEADCGKERRFRVRVDGSGTLYLPLDIAPLMSSAATPHKQLSKGQAVSTWLKTRHVDPLHNLIGASRARDGVSECILLLGPRSRLDAYADAALPMGLSIGALVGFSYVLADGRVEAWRGSNTDSPLIYACSDVEMARELIRNPPAGVERWRVVVDNAKFMRALHAALMSDGGGELPPICAFAELQDREIARDLLARGCLPWYLEDQDVQPPPSRFHRSPPNSSLLERSLDRVGNHWTVSQRIRSVRHGFLEALADWGARAEECSADGVLAALEVPVALFMRRAIGCPLPLPQSEKALSTLLHGLRSCAASQRIYSQLGHELHEICAGFDDRCSPLSARMDALISVLGEGSRTARTVVVCRSMTIATSCEQAFRSQNGMERVVWTNLEGLRLSAPFDRVIVPGWIDRMSMRELASVGYGEAIELVLYPFEARWFEKTTQAVSRWERKLERDTGKMLGALSERVMDREKASAAWQKEMAKRFAAASTPAVDDPPHCDDDAPEFEILENRSIDALRKAAIAGRENQPTIKALLVVFEQPGAHAFLPVGSKVIVLTDGSGRRPQPSQGHDAERYLYRSVSTLESGCVLAFSQGADRDLIDARADQFMKDASKVRTTASLWKAAIKRLVGNSALGHAVLADRLSKAGVRRDPATVRSWASFGSSTVAPRGYREVVPVIARLSGHAELVGDIPGVLSAIDLIYRARAKAADAIVQELFAGDIDIDSDILEFDVGGVVLRYSLERIQRVEGVMDVPNEIVGRVRYMSNADQHVEG